MSIPVTAADLARANRLLEAVEANDRKGLARELAEIREEALSCAMVRVERLMDVKWRKQPGLPFDDATLVRSTGDEK